MAFMTDDCVFEASFGPEACGVFEWTFTGTRAGDGMRIETHGCDLFTFRDGRIHIKNSWRKMRT